MADQVGSFSRFQREATASSTNGDLRRISLLGILRSRYAYSKIGSVFTCRFLGHAKLTCSSTYVHLSPRVGPSRYISGRIWIYLWKNCQLGGGPSAAFGTSPVLDDCLPVQLRISGDESSNISYRGRYRERAHSRRQPVTVSCLLVSDRKLGCSPCIPRTLRLHPAIFSYSQLTQRLLSSDTLSFEVFS